MSKISLLEKLQVLWKVSSSSYWLPIVLILLLGFAYLLLLTNPKNKKRNQMIYIGFSFVMAVLLIIIYHPSLNQFFDYFMNHIFIAVLFPNPALYFCMIVIMNIIVWTSIFHFKSSNIIKRVNVVVYIIMNYLLALTLQVVDSSKLNIFQEASLFANKKALALIQLSGSIFILWILFLILYKIILIYIRKDYKPKIRKVIIAKKKFPENYVPVDPPFYLLGNAGKRVTLVEAKVPKEDTAELEKMLTVEDYRLLRKLLKEEKEKEKKDNKEDVLEKQKAIREKAKKIEREKIAEMKLQEKLREEEKFTELEMLYRSMK